MKKYLTLKNILSVVIAFIFIQSMFFKFTGAPETVYIFNTLGMWAGFDWFSNYGAYMVGTAELVASILLFTRFHGFGALIAFGAISGAIIFHLFTPLGIEMPVYVDGIETASGLMPTVGDLLNASINLDLPSKYVVVAHNQIFVPTELDGGALFAMACVVWVSASVLIFKEVKLSSKTTA